MHDQEDDSSDLPDYQPPPPQGSRRVPIERRGTDTRYVSAQTFEAYRIEHHDQISRTTAILSQLQSDTGEIKRALFGKTPGSRTVFEQLRNTEERLEALEAQACIQNTPAKRALGWAAQALVVLMTGTIYAGIMGILFAGTVAKTVETLKAVAPKIEVQK